MAAARDDEDPKIEKFFGLRNTVRPESFELGDLEAAANVDIDDALKLKRRKGFSDVLFIGAGYHSLFAANEVLVAGNGTALVRLFPDATSAVLRTGLNGARLTYGAVGPRIYYMDGVSTGCVDAGRARSWGLESPSAQPVATAVGGGLPAGTYQYAVTYVRSDGQESGTGTGGAITLAIVGGIAFTSLPVSADPDVVGKRLYISPVDGDELFAAQLLAAEATEATYYFERPGTVPLRTQFLQPPIVGQALASFGGRVYVARGRKLHATESYAPELMDLRRGITFPGYITLLAPVDDGLYVWLENDAVFLPGGDLTKFEYREMLGYGAIPGALAYADAEDIEPELTGRTAIVGSKQGACACLNGGTIKNLTKERFAYPATARGAAVVRAHGGMIQYLMVLEGTGSAANVA